MPSAPFNPQDDAGLLSSTGAVESRAFVAHYQAADPIALSNTAVRASTVAAEAGETATSGFTNPDFPRALIVKPGGTAADVATGTVVVHGTDACGAALSESFTTAANTVTAITGDKAFATVTSAVISAQDGAAAEFSIGVCDKLGLNHCLNRNTVLTSFLNGALEGTAATVTTSATVLASNTVDLNSALDTNQVDIYYLVEGDD